MGTNEFFMFYFYHCIYEPCATNYSRMLSAHSLNHMDNEFELKFEHEVPVFSLSLSKTHTTHCDCHSCGFIFHKTFNHLMVQCQSFVRHLWGLILCHYWLLIPIIIGIYGNITKRYCVFSRVEGRKWYLQPQLAFSWYIIHVS